MSTEWYCSRDGQEKGPISAEQLRQFVNDRRIRPDDLLWREGMSEWVAANSIKGLFPVGLSSPAPTTTGKSANEKFCHECGEVIRLKAEICPKCGVRQPVAPSERRIEVDRSGLTTPVLISAVGNIVFGLVWIGTICGIPIGLAMLIMCVCEFLYFSDSDKKTPQELISTVRWLAFFELVVGLFNIVSFVCGILLFINKGKYQRMIEGL